MKKQILLLGILMSTGSLMQGQDFSGQYSIESKEMVDGQEYLNAIAQSITVKQTKDSISITRVTPAGGDNTTTSTITLPINGSHFVRTSNNRKRDYVVKMDAAKKTMIITGTISFENKPEEAEYTNTEIWTLGVDGQLTILKTSDATLTDDWTIKAVFKKES